MTRRDVIWVTLESLRWDHTSFASHSRDTTPNLASLASDGVAFDDCYSHDVWTRSSTASMLTGYAPSAHQTWSNDAKLPEEITTIPESFSTDGYRTVGISPNGQFSPETGLDRGFDEFHYLTRSSLFEESGPRVFAKWLLNLRRHSGGFTRDGNQHCIGYIANNIGKRYIDESSEEPLFLYVHHGDSHHAYVPPIAWRDHFGDDLPMPIDDAISLALEMSDDLHEVIAADEPFTEAEMTALRTLYDTSVAYVDYLTGELVSYAKRHLDDPIVVVTGDHGELFGERRLFAHMLVTNTAASNVPLVVSGIPGLPDGGLVQHADVMRMLCDEVGVDHPVPIGRDIRAEPRDFAVVQRGGARARHKLERISRHNEAFPTDEFHADDLTSIRTGRWRYQQSPEGSELFDLEEEREDVRTGRTDVSGAYPSVATDLEERCQSWLRDVGQPVGEVGAVDFDDATEAQLRNLGYL